MSPIFSGSAANAGVESSVAAATAARPWMTRRRVSDEWWCMVASFGVNVSVRNVV